MKDVYMSKLDERINNRKNKKINKYKKLRNFKILSVIFMINITIGCIFFTDYNMNKMLNRESTINKMFFKILILPTNKKTISLSFNLCFSFINLWARFIS